MSPALFGTDGIRSRVGEFPLENNFLSRLAQALTCVAPANLGNVVLMARDTRVSGPGIARSLREGFRRGRFFCLDFGVLPTPSLSFLVPHHRAALGCMISASHNPPEFNGVKFFGPNGRKIPRQWELKVERMLHGKDRGRRVEGRGRTTSLIPSSFSLALSAEESYLDFLRSCLSPDTDFRGMRVAVDGAYGAAGRVLPEIFKRLGAEVSSRACSPSGRRINVDSGAMDPGPLSQMVRRNRVDIGFALDGDGDRLVVVDEKGRVLAGEWVMATVACERRSLRERGSEGMVTTIVSNSALKDYLRTRGMDVRETAVGDRWVLDELLASGFGFGGENSGHYIWPFILPSADGLLAAMLLLEMVRRKGRPASQCFLRFPLYPKAGLQVPAPSSKPDLENLGHFQRTLGRFVGEVRDRGRILARYSGTEPVLRLLVEGRLIPKRLQRICLELKEAFLKDVG